MKEQIHKVKQLLQPNGNVQECLTEFTTMIQMFFTYMEDKYAQENNGKGCKVPSKGCRSLQIKSKKSKDSDKEKTRTNRAKRS